MYIKYKMSLKCEQPSFDLQEQEYGPVPTRDEENSAAGATAGDISLKAKSAKDKRGGHISFRVYLRSYGLRNPFASC